MDKFYINPYNFVPFCNQPVRTEKRVSAEGEQLHTGEINCTLTIQTPLAIPDSFDNNSQEHKEYPFYSIDGNHIIPGSEIRGMIRNIYETITDSCFSVINSNTLTRRDNIAMESPGLLQFDRTSGEWHVYQARRYPCYTESVKAVTTQYLSEKNVSYVERKWALFPSLKSSWDNMKKTVDSAIHSAKDISSFFQALEKKDLQVIEKDPIVICWRKDLRNSKTKKVAICKKWGEQYSIESLNNFFSLEISERENADPYKEAIICTSLYCIDGENPIVVSSAEVENYFEILDFYKAYSPDSGGIYDAIKPKKDGQMYPLFFTTNSNAVKLRPAQLSRTVYKNTVSKLLGNYAPCDGNNVCPACKLFGRIAYSPIASRVRFSDATECGNVKMSSDFGHKYIMLKELSSPKLTSVAFYSVKNDMSEFEGCEDWTYDSPNVKLRGRKMYFHNPQACFDNINPDNPVYCAKEKDRTKRNSSFELALRGSFNFKVYFDRITDDELGVLVWALTLGDPDGKTMLMHKLGHGKPLGLGSVKITIDKKGIIERFCNGTSYSLSECDAGKLLNNIHIPTDRTETMTALLSICDFNFCLNLENNETINEQIGYPIGTNGVGKNAENSMQWFNLNKSGVGRNRREYEFVLRTLLDNDGKPCSVKALRLIHLTPETVDQRRNARNENRRSNGSPQSQLCGVTISSVNHRNENEAVEKLVEGKYYTATIVGRHTSPKGDKYIEIVVSGQKADVMLFRCPPKIRNDPDAAVRNRETIGVIYNGKNQYNKHKFWVKG